jgi:hypothetical protein
VEPADPADAHRPLATAAGGRPLDEVLCEQERRAVGQDWCVRWRNRHLQIAPEHAGLDLAGKEVLVRHKRDGTVLLEHEWARLAWTAVPHRPPPPKKAKPAVVNNKPWKPAAGHPWRRAAVPRKPAAG